MPEYTEITCSSPASAHALHAYLLIELGDEEEPPKISARVIGLSLRVTHGHDDEAVRLRWDAQLIGYRDGRESLQDVLLDARDAVESMDLSRRNELLRRIDGALG